MSKEVSTPSNYIPGILASQPGIPAALAYSMASTFGRGKEGIASTPGGSPKQEVNNRARDFLKDKVSRDSNLDTQSRAELLKELEGDINEQRYNELAMRFQNASQENPSQTYAVRRAYDSVYASYLTRPGRRQTILTGGNRSQSGGGSMLTGAA